MKYTKYVYCTALWLISLVGVISALYRGEVKIPTDTGHQVKFFIRNHKGPGTYKYGYDTGGDGILVARSFKLEEKNELGEVHGEYGFVNPYGVLKRYSYVSDTNGYRVKENLGEDIDIETIHILGGKSIKTTRKPTSTKKFTKSTTKFTKPTKKFTKPTKKFTKPTTKFTKTTTPVEVTTLEPTTPKTTSVTARKPPRRPLIIGPIPRPFFPPLDR